MMIVERTPFVGHLRPAPRASAYRGPYLGQTFDGTLGVPNLVGDVLRLVAHGLTAYLGLHVGTTERGWLSIAGWAVGLLQGMGAFVDLLTIAANIQEARKTGEEAPQENFVAFNPRN